MSTRYITFSAGTSNVMTTSVIAMLFSVAISTLKARKKTFERSYDKQNITLVRGHSCNVLYVFLFFSFTIDQF